MVITAQRMARQPLSRPDLAAGDMDAATIAADLRKQIEKTANDPAPKTASALNDLETILTRTLATFLAPQDDNAAMLPEFLSRTRPTGEADHLRREENTEQAVIQLAQSATAGIDDLAQT